MKIPSTLFDTVYNMPLWQKILIFVASWVVPIALFWYLFLAARIGEIDSISSRIPKLKQEIAALEQKSKQLPKIEKELKEMEGLLKQAMKLLPEKEDIPSVLTEISSLGNEARLEFEEFKPGKEQIHDFYAAIPVSLKLKGPFHNTVVFFDRVSRMARIVHIENVTMGKAKEASQIWSQAVNSSSNKAAGAKGGSQAAASGAKPGGDGSKGVVQRGSNWVISTKCTAVTYRFLTPEEQERLKKEKKNKKKKKRRR
ncbi:MAG: type 4a pilus biogenesis protein PilO [Thermodesulfobacteria bacterium]|nr:type 4a pilus biogenesis protein PilO [Thermodesulfobacteriota bacterium]